MLSIKSKARLAAALRLFHTTRHLKFKQGIYFFLRRGIGYRAADVITTEPQPRLIQSPPSWKYPHHDKPFNGHTFTFLNQTKSFPRGAVDWCPKDTSRLWRYNLHYFDFLQDSQRSVQEKKVLIAHWIAANPPGSEPAWEPYTCSLRIVNWCRFFWSLPASDISSEWRDSLHEQTRWLERNLELHILANHFFENIKAMLFAGCYFADARGAGWLAKSQRLLVLQLREQTLADGGHYERSPQYHCIMLESYLDIYALAQSNLEIIANTTAKALRPAIKNGLKFLAAIATPDDEIPQFNDSALGAATKPAAIAEKAKSLGFDTSPLISAIINQPASGLYGWKSTTDYFLIDCGDIGPAYQPGHTHCDFLSYVLMHDKKWLVVDTGVYEYEPGLMRNYVRSTQAHNTISVDDQEQSEIWGEFRVGRRAKKLRAEVLADGTFEDARRHVFTGAYRGFPTIAGGATHSRKATIDIARHSSINCLEIEDVVEARGDHRVISAIHFHPSLKIIIKNSQATILYNSEVLAVVTPKYGEKLDVADGWYCPEFGTKQANQTLLLKINGRHQIKTGYTLQLIS